MKFLISILLLVSSVAMASDTLVELHVQRQYQVNRITKIETVLKSNSLDTSTKERLTKILDKHKVKLQQNAEMIKFCIELDTINNTNNNKIAKK